jgi:hypothetical protein
MSKRVRASSRLGFFHSVVSFLARWTVGTAHAVVAFSDVDSYMAQELEGRPALIAYRQAE